MKTKVTTLLLFFIVAFTNAQEFKSPVEYLNYIAKETDIISKSTWKYTLAAAHSKNARRIDATRKKLVTSIQNATKKIEALKDGYKGDVEYRNQLLAYFAISEKNINQEYDKIIDMQEVADQSYDAMEAYIVARDLVNKKINDEVDKLNANQKIFANKYNIQITEDQSELGKKMKISNEVYANHTQLYLIFYKVNYTENSLMKAIAANDLNAIQQNANALERYSNEGVEKLKAYKGYENDMMLANATKKVLEFTKKEALVLAPSVVTYLMMNQKLEDSKKTIESKAAEKRTSKEIETFNNLVDQVNKEVGVYNNANNNFNAERSNVINNWNEIGNEFISKHVPID